METLKSQSGEGDSHSESINIFLQQFESLHERWKGVLDKITIHDLESKIGRGEDLLYRCEHQKVSSTLLLEIERYLLDASNFIVKLKVKVKQYEGKETATLVSQSPHEAIVCYLKFSKFYTYYNPYIFDSWLRNRLGDLRKQLFGICVGLQSEIDGHVIYQQKVIFCYNLVVLLPGLCEHLQESCDIAKLRNDIDDISDYLHTHWM